MSKSSHADNTGCSAVGRASTPCCLYLPELKERDNPLMYHTLFCPQMNDFDSMHSSNACVADGALSAAQTISPSLLVQACLHRASDHPQYTSNMLLICIYIYTQALDTTLRQIHHRGRHRVLLSHAIVGYRSVSCWSKFLH